VGLTQVLRIPTVGAQLAAPCYPGLFTIFSIIPFSLTDVRE
jgi:hypothetical protein